MTTEYIGSLNGHELAVLKIHIGLFDSSEAFQILRQVEPGMSDTTYRRRLNDASLSLEKKGLLTREMRKDSYTNWSPKAEAIHSLPTGDLNMAIMHLQSKVLGLEGELSKARDQYSDVVKESSAPTKPAELFDGLQFHQAIVEASRLLFADGHYSAAIFESFKRVNNEVKEVSGVNDRDLRDLMAHVFSEKHPLISLNALTNQSDRDEQEGFKLVFMGAMQGIRNPKAHEAVPQNDPHKTLEYLGLASLLLKRLDERES